MFGNRPANPFPAYAIFITDGDPTTSNTSGGSTNNDYRDHALDEAAALKAAIGATGGKVIGIGAGSNFTQPASQARLASVVDEMVPVANMGDLPAVIEAQLDTVCAPVVSIEKTAAPTSLPEPGGTVDYSVSVTNESALSQADVHLTDFSDDRYPGFPGNAACVLEGTPVADPFDVRIPYGQTLSCSWTESSTFQDQDPGFTITNTATTRGADPKGRPTAPKTDKATVVVTDLPSSIEVTKTERQPDSRPEPGGFFTFDVTVRNASAVDTATISTLDDNIHGDLNGSRPGLQSSCAVPRDLDPGEAYQCAFTVEINGGPGDYPNTVTATGTDDDGNPVTAADNATVTILDVPSEINVTTTANPTTVPEPGGDVTFTATIDNDSTVDEVTIATLIDNVHGNLNGQGSCILPQTIAAGGTYTCSFTANVSGNGGDTEIDTVTATGTDDDGNPVTAADNATVTILESRITLVKTGALGLGNDGVANPGDVIAYEFAVTNASDFTVVGIQVDDLDLGGINVSCPETELAIGEAMSCTASYPITQDDINSGEVHNCAAVAGQYENIGTVTGTDALKRTVGDSDTSHYYGVDSAIDIEKTGALGLGDDGIANPGDVITYAFEVANDGNADLIEIDVEDLDLGGITVSCPGTALAAGESMTCTAEYAVSQTDINEGSVNNCVIASGLDPIEGAVSDEDCFETVVGQSPSISVLKIAEPEIIPIGSASDVTWTIDVTNTGNVPLADVTIADPLVPSCDANIGDLEIGATATQLCTSTHTPDSLSWTFTNVAVATGVGPDGTEVTDNDEATLLPIQVLGTAQLGDTVWNDTNKNGVQDSGEAGINGAVVVLKDANGTVIATATTAKGPWDGWYKFVGLDAGRYTASLDMSSVSGSLTTASSFTVDLADGVEYLDANFGLAEALPQTGANMERMLIAALLMLGVGGALILSTRRRQEEM